MDVLDEMCHLLMGKIEFVESIHHSRDFLELVGVSYAESPGSAKAMVYSLELPEEVVNLLENNHHFIREYG